MRAKSNKIVNAVFVDLKGVGHESVTKLLRWMLDNNVYPIGPSTSGGPNGMYVATHRAEDAPAIRKIWKQIQQEEKERAKPFRIRPF